MPEWSLAQELLSIIELAPSSSSQRLPYLLASEYGRTAAGAAAASRRRRVSIGHDAIQGGGAAPGRPPLGREDRWSRRSRSRSGPVGQSKLTTARPADMRLEQHDREALESRRQDEHGGVSHTLSQSIGRGVDADPTRPARGRRPTARAARAATPCRRYRGSSRGAWLRRPRTPAGSRSKPFWRSSRPAAISLCAAGSPGPSGTSGTALGIASTGGTDGSEQVLAGRPVGFRERDQHGHVRQGRRQGVSHAPGRRRPDRWCSCAMTMTPGRGQPAREQDQGRSRRDTTMVPVRQRSQPAHEQDVGPQRCHVSVSRVVLMPQP